jgi:type I restriction enzyme R subunit
MNALTKSPVRVFDPTQGVTVVDRRLPHWSQAGAISFITWRTFDSLPKEVIERLIADRNEWLRLHGIASPGECQQLVQSLSPMLRQQFNHLVSERWHEALDSCSGECVLCRTDLSQIVAKSLLHFDGDRYELTDFVIMPNHVHVLVAFPDETSMLRQCDSWKHYTATQINRRINRNGRFWQQDGFDHLVRSIEQFDYLRRYIADNPKRAKLQTGKFIHWSKAL